MRRIGCGALFLISSLCAEDPASLEVPVDFSLPLTGQVKRNFLGEKLSWKGNSVKLNQLFVRTDKNSVLHGHVQDSQLSWEWGFRSGIKYDDFQEDWNLAATYTHFHSKSFGSMQKDGFLLPLWQDAGNQASTWRLDMEISDVEVGKTFRLEDLASFRPHLGVRTTWMYQKFDLEANSSFSEGFFQDQVLWNNCLGIGGRSGFDSLWNLGDGLKLFGDGALSWLTGYHNIHQRQSLVDIGSSEIEIRPNAAIAIAEFSLGFQYDLQSFNMRLGYELSYFLNKNRWADLFSSDGQAGKISLQGLSLSLCFVF